MTDFLLGRQPILDSEQRLFGYELLARDCREGFHGTITGDEATSRVLLDTLVELGLEAVTGGLPAFVNVTRGFLTGEHPLPPYPDQLVIEILETIEPDAPVIAGARELRRRGFRLAIDDYVGARPELAPLLELAEIIKIDCLGLSPEELGDLVAQLRPGGQSLLAEKVETHEQFRTCRDLGFDMFQGFFFARPDLLSSRSVPAVRANLLRLAAELQSPDCELEHVQEIIEQDPALSYKLLLYMNSALHGMPRRIGSIREVVVYLGLHSVRNMATLLLLTNLDHKPNVLLTTAMIRARMCELLGKPLGGGVPGRAFTVGLLSTLDGLLDRDMDEIVRGLPLAEEVASALCTRSGELGRLLEAVIAVEQNQPLGAGLEPAHLQRCFLESVRWARDLMPGLGLGPR